MTRVRARLTRFYSKMDNTTITYEGIQLTVSIKAVKALRLVVRRDGSVSLVVPLWCDKNKVMDFLNDKKDWLRNAVAKSKHRLEKQKDYWLHDYAEGELFTYLGNRYPLHYRLTEKGVPQAELKDGQLVVSSSRWLTPQQAMLVINAWYAKQFKTLVKSYLAYWLPRMNEAPLSVVRYKVMKSRWGSMMPASRVVCFNFNLVFYPERCLEMVVVHELCHLKESSHNRHFHELMASYLPDYKARVLILKEN